MKVNKVLIISLLPLRPVKSGMQNTVFLLHKFLKEKKINLSFIQIKNNNSIDPVFNLNFNRTEAFKIKDKIKKFKPNLIFINTTKLFYLYKNEILKKDRDYKIINVCHDLYFFRKKFFKNIRKKDNNKFSFKKELRILKLADYIIDFSIKEKKYLIKNNIQKKKLIFTSTPTEINRPLLKNIKKYDLIFPGSEWIQNKISLKWTIKNIFSKIDNLSFLVLGVKYNFTSYIKNISNKDYNKKYFKKSKLGIAIIKEGTGRKVKIFEMLSSGLPVITNLNLEQYGLKNNKHYVFEKRKLKIIKTIKDLIINKRKRNNLSINAYKWSKKNTYYKFAFKKINYLL